MIALLLEVVTCAAAAAGQSARSGRLLAAADAVRQTLSLKRDPFLARALEPIVRLVQAALGEERWVAVTTAGRARSLEEAIAEALDEARYIDRSARDWIDRARYGARRPNSLPDATDMRPPHRNLIGAAPV